MSDQFVGEIRCVAFNFAPLGWTQCDGQILSISQNTALFSLLGTFYGGNGTSTFALPNLQGCVAMDSGSGAGLTTRNVGDTGGSPTVTLLTTELPAHNHVPQAETTAGTTPTAGPGAFFAKTGSSLTAEYRAGAPNALMSPGALATAGNGQPHNNLMPFVVMYYVIALQGIFPARS
jgi:microcystin-dependent protein